MECIPSHSSRQNGVSYHKSFKRDPHRHEILRVDVTKLLYSIHNKITEIVERIKSLKEQGPFIAWDIDSEFNPEIMLWFPNVGRS